MTCQHDARFGGVFDARNGCVVCELEHIQVINIGLVNRLGAIAEAFHRCVNKLQLECPKCGTSYCGCNMTEQCLERPQNPKELTLNGYQRQAMTTAVYKQVFPCAKDRPNLRPTEDGRLDYAVLGLCGEVGELANKRKKWLRGDFGPDGQFQAMAAIVAELGDVLWYAAAIADELGLGLEQVASANLDKLRKRQDAGQLASGATTEDR